MKVFKFGGASVKDAEGVRNLGNVVGHFKNDHLCIVVSAMGKTTNAMEGLLGDWTDGNDWRSRLTALRVSHVQVHTEVADGISNKALNSSFDSLSSWLGENRPTEYDMDYDHVVSHGELWSTLIVSDHLNAVGLNNEWIDARQIIKTDSTYRSARVNWKESQKAFEEFLGHAPRRFVVQGFIASNEQGNTTTLGREGSDFSASIIAYLGDAQSVTIWKDVAGMFNADPNKFEDTVLLEQISYREAIELSYFGASVIHPRTVKPLENKHIPLYVRSFKDLGLPGSVIGDSTDSDSLVPSFITKPEQVLISITPRDLSFIVEEHMSEIFGVFAKHRVRIDLTQNSALAFSAVVPDSEKLEPLIQELQTNYEVRFNKGVELLTVRHYDEPTLEKLIKDRQVLLEQRSRSTARFVVW